MSRHYAAFPVASLKAVPDAPAGTFEAIVSVFGNVDFAGDRIVEGAFAKSIERWRASGDPIPVIWSHQWHDPDAYIGEADPKTVEELPAGHPDLPEPIRALGGLRVRATIDTDDPTGRKVLKLLKRRAVREFSFAYDVFDERRAGDGANELLELDVIEVGPTLKGANPLTQLVGAKAAAIARRLPDVDVDELTKAIEAELGAGPTEEEPPTGEPISSKALGDLAGILERLDSTLDPVGLTVTVTAKAGARNSAADSARLQTLHDLTLELGAKCAEPSSSSSEEEEEEAKADTPTGSRYVEALAATIDAELLELT